MGGHRNKKGYEVARQFRGKLTHVAPVWFQLRRYSPAPPRRQQRLLCALYPQEHVNCHDDTFQGEEVISLSYTISVGRACWPFLSKQDWRTRRCKWSLCGEVAVVWTPFSLYHSPGRADVVLDSGL